MDVDIYITEVEGGRELRVPWLPDKVRCMSNGTRMSSYEILDFGEVNVPSGSNLTDFSWTSYLPGEGHKDLPFLRGTWKDPKYIQGIFSEWREYGLPLRLIVTGTPINHDVYLYDYEVEYESGYGDYKYTIFFKKRRRIKIQSEQVAPLPTGGTSGGSGSSGGGGTYTVKSGDTLWGIAQKFLGSGAQYGTIYSLNQTIIEETAQSRGKSSSDGGHWIYPGTVLSLP